jgi:Spherulation-specific family 4
VTLVGYISTSYAKREIIRSLDDIDAYWQWDALSKAKDGQGFGPMGLDGIFVDEVTCCGENFEYFELLSHYIQNKSWRSGKPGYFGFVTILMVGYVVFNPGCAPRDDAYYHIADLVIVFEHFYHNFINPPLDESVYVYLAHDIPENGLTLMIPEPSNDSPISKFGLMIHDFLPEENYKDKLVKLKEMVFDLVQIKRVRAIFITDLEIKKVDVYANWSHIWHEFVNFVAQANSSINGHHSVD